MANYKKWSSAEVQYVRDNMDTYSDLDLAAKLSAMTGENITHGMVRRQRRKLGTNKARGRKKQEEEEGLKG